MATVGITKELRERVGNIIGSMQAKEIKSDLPEFDRIYNVDASYLFHYGCWGKEHMHLIQEIPHEWLTKLSEVYISVEGVLENGTRMKQSVRFAGLSAFSRPAESYRISDSVIKIENLQAISDVVAGRAELLKRWEDGITAKEIAGRWKKVKTDIDEFLCKCKTLNEAVKLFPNVRLYIASEDLERLDRKAERKAERMKLLDDIPTDELTAAAIASKLMGTI